MTTAPPETSPRRPAWRALLIRGPQAALVVVALALMLRTDRFFDAENLASILEVASLVGVLAVGQAFALIGGGFDLSQGAALGLAAAVAARLVDAGAGPVVAGLAAVALGTGLGAINGGFVAAVRTNPFVTTLSASMIFQGASLVVLSARGGVISVGAFRPMATQWAVGGVGLPSLGLIFLACAAAAWVVLRRTVFGQHVYATGGNAEAARLAGVRTGRVTLATFALSGAAAGLAAVMWLAWLGVARSETGRGYELNAIAACVVGGVSLQGGTGSVLGAAAGAVLFQALANLLTLSGFPDEYSQLVTGAVLLAFAAADALARRGDRR